MLHQIKISCHHYTMSKDDDSSDDRKFYMQKMINEFLLLWTGEIS